MRKQPGGSQLRYLMHLLEVESNQSDDTGKHDVCSVSLQEVDSKPHCYLRDLWRGEDPWAGALKDALAEVGYKRVARVRVLGTVLNLFVHERHLLAVRDVETSFKRLANLGLKAAVSARLRLYGVSLCFVAVHLSAHDHAVEARVREYNAVIDELAFKNTDTPRILYHDYVFFCGDTNMRLAEKSFTFDQIVRRVNEGQLSELLSQDQLRHVQREERAFAELSEQDISFQPTYKYVIGRGQELHRKRRPAWPDRVLFRCNTYNYEDFVLDLRPESYFSGSLIECSDHKPVVAKFSVTRVCPSDRQAANIGRGALAAVVTFRRPQFWALDCDCYAVYDVRAGELGHTCKWDWIGLFPSTFCSLNDYVSYNYASPCRRTGVPKAVLVSGLFTPGRYRLLYIGVNQGVGNCILGMSQDFWVDRVAVDEQAEVAEEEEERLL